MTDYSRAAALDRFIDSLTCNPPIYTWHYDTSGNLISTNSPYNVYEKVFEHSGCLDYLNSDPWEDLNPLVLSASLGIMWCAVAEHDGERILSYYVIGPVFHDEVSNSVLDQAIMRYRIDPASRMDFINSMREIPAVSTILFFQLAVLLHFFVNDERISRSDLRFQANPDSAKQKKAKSRSRYKTYQTEQALLQLVREGDTNYHAVLAKAGQISSGVGIKTGDPVNRAILSSSNFVALCTRASIEGGLSPDEAYTVGDNYIQSLIECRTISDVQTINHTMYEDFIMRVHKQKKAPEYSRQIQSCISYINMHLDEELTLSLLAREMGYSEYHLSRKFKAETGLNIRDYIKNARIDRAKLLLSTTDLSVKEIAEQLCFCSASHFTQIFRDITGVLPGVFRKTNQP